MTLVAEYSLVFHPDPQVFPILRTARLGGQVITRPGYSFPVYLDTQLYPGTVLLARSLLEPESKAIAAYQRHMFDDEDHAKWSHVAIVGPDG
jgi:hypothetical protein